MLIPCTTIQCASRSCRRLLPARLRSPEPKPASQFNCRPLSTKRKDNESVELPDGRIMGYSEHGNSNGSPFLYFHGFPSSRLEGIGLDRVARKRNLRVLTLERPGFGISTPQPGRRVIDFARDVNFFIEHLSLGKVAILGGSGGGPYALACAHELPRRMLSAVGLFASGGPYDKSWEGIPLRSRLGVFGAKYAPSALRAVGTGIVGTAKWALRTGPGSRWFESILQKARENQENPHNTMTLAEEREDSIRTMFEGFVQGSEAFVEEAAVMGVRPWGFDLEKVRFPIQIFHGDKDTNAPILWIRNMARRLPDCRLKEFPGESHYTLVSHMEGVLAEVVPDSLEEESNCGR